MRDIFVMMMMHTTTTTMMIMMIIRKIRTSGSRRGSMDMSLNEMLAILVGLFIIAAILLLAWDRLNPDKIAEMIQWGKITAAE